LADGRALLNFGCGVKMDPAWINLDFSPYAWLAHHRQLARTLNMLGVLSDQRFRRLLRVDPEIIYWDVRHGMPFESGSLDVVYSSHVLEHLERLDALGLLVECRRVLRPGGIMRVVVPDLEALVRNYVESIPKDAGANSDQFRLHHLAVEQLLEQMVRDEPYGTGSQPELVRRLERLWRGSARQAGEQHRWMYDRYSLADALTTSGFIDVRIEGSTTSRIAGWTRFGLDTNPDGSAYLPNSLYIETLVPAA